MSKPPLLLLGLCLAFICRSQSGLYITDASTFAIKANTTVVIDGLALIPSTHYTITGINHLNRNATLTHPSITFSINRSFQWNTTLTAFTGNIGFYYDETELNGLAESDLTLNVHDGTQWQAYKSGVVHNTAANLVTTPVNNVLLNEISLAAEALPLPLKWSSVSATRESQKAHLKWETYNEVQVSYFTIERSTDGLQWNLIGNPIPAINKPGVNQYYFYDYSIPDSKTYYRIKQVDNNWQYSYSSVVQVTAAQNLSAISINPNPATYQAFIQSKSKLIKALYIYSASGQLLKTVQVSSAFQLALPVETLPNGVYTLHVLYTDNTCSAVSFIKN